MKTLKKHWKWAIVAAIVVLLAAIFATWRPVKYPATQAYVVGGSNLPGARWTRRSSWKRAMPLPSPRMKTAGPCSKTPPRPSGALRAHYGQGIWLIQKELHMLPLTPYTYSPYAMNGWAPTSGTAEAQEQAEFVTRFIDIYENSFQH